MSATLALASAPTASPEPTGISGCRCPVCGGEDTLMIDVANACAKCTNSDADCEETFTPEVLRFHAATLTRLAKWIEACPK